MAITVTGKLNKAATQFNAGESTGFGIRLGVKYYDRETKADSWTNYEAVVFAKAPAQVQFYQSALVEGSIVEMTGDKCKIRQFQGNNGLSLSIEILDAKLGFVSGGQQPQQQQHPQQRQPSQQRQAPPAGYQNQMPQQQGNYHKNGSALTSTNQQRPQQQQGYQQPDFTPPDFEDDIPY